MAKDGERMKVRIKGGFRYDFAGEIDTPQDRWQERFDAEKKVIAEEIKKELDNDFGAEGTVSDFDVTYEVVSE